jgi:DNA-binding NarL/FixJ family response regulator
VVDVMVQSDDPIVDIGLKSQIRSIVRFNLVTAVGRDASNVVVVLAVGTADASTIELLQGMGIPRLRCCLIVENEWSMDVAAAVAAGVRAVLWLADCTPARLDRLITLVDRGWAEFPASLQGGLLDYIDRVQRDVLAPRGLTVSGLSAREIEVVRLVAEGLSLGEIAQRMSYSERTVKNIAYGLMRRLNVRNRTHMVSYAIRAGFI